MFRNQYIVLMGCIKLRSTCSLANRQGNITLIQALFCTILVIIVQFGIHMLFYIKKCSYYKCV